jgi:2-phosphoglycerate kinase
MTTIDKDIANVIDSRGIHRVLKEMTTTNQALLLVKSSMDDYTILRQELRM